MKKLGWGNLLSADTETWFSEETSKYHEELFGIPKGILIVCELDKGLEHSYAPAAYFEKLQKHIHKMRKKNYTRLAKILNSFYELRKQAKKEIPRLQPRDLSKLSNAKLANIYQQNRDWVHKISAYDQFSQIAEDMWNTDMEKILVDKCKLTKDTEEYMLALFALSKPEHISTTLTEQRELLKAVHAVKAKKKSIEQAASKLAKQFGYMPVYAYGDAWDSEHYLLEIKKLMHSRVEKLVAEIKLLQKYKTNRNKLFDELVKKYNLNKQEIQIFIEFGLVSDIRNEAGYLVSFCGLFLGDLYKEMAKRLRISVRELRCLFEKEIMMALQGKADVADLLSQKGSTAAYGFDASMKKRINFSSSEAKKLFAYLQKNTHYAQGGNTHKGVCANPGTIIGTARIILDPKDNNRIKKGDILVAICTSVDYLPAMQKASAFVTEVGGLTCHAAVVARELGIPCIVALSNATKTIKDGEKIKIDATNGTVEKI